MLSKEVEFILTLHPVYTNDKFLVC
jgi:hypothetical protein